MDKKLPKIVTINLDWNGERYPFSFRLVKPGTPAPVYTNLAAVTPQTPDAGMVVGAADAAAAGAPGSPASDRKSVVQGKSVSVRVDVGGRRIIKKKTQAHGQQQQTTSTTHSNTD